MAAKFIVQEEPEEIQEPKKVGRPKGTPNKPKMVTAEKKEYGTKNPHPDKGTYIKVPMGTVDMSNTNLYIGVASTGGMGVTNIRFSLPPMDFGDGVLRVLTVHSGWGNLLVERTPEEIKAMNLKGKRSGWQVHELPGYVIDSEGNSNIEEVLGEKRSKE